MDPLMSSSRRLPLKRLLSSAESRLERKRSDCCSIRRMIRSTSLSLTRYGWPISWAAALVTRNAEHKKRSDTTNSLCNIINSLSDWLLGRGWRGDSIIQINGRFCPDDVKAYRLLHTERIQKQRSRSEEESPGAERTGGLTRMARN